MNPAQDAIFLLESDAAGNPRRGGGHGHWCYWSPDPNFEVVNQMRDGGVYPSFDCFIACAQMAARRRGGDIGTRMLEQLAGTRPPYGTGVQPGINALRHYLACHGENGSPPSGGYVGNPAMGAKVQGDGAYLAASYDVTVVIDVPLRGAVQEDAMNLPQAKAVATAFREVFYELALHRNPESVAAVEVPDADQLAQAFLHGDENNVINALTTGGWFGSAEFNAQRAAGKS